MQAMSELLNLVALLLLAAVVVGCLVLLVWRGYRGRRIAVDAAAIAVVGGLAGALVFVMGLPWWFDGVAWEISWTLVGASFALGGSAGFRVGEDLVGDRAHRWGWRSFAGAAGGTLCALLLSFGALVLGSGPGEPPRRVLDLALLAASLLVILSAVLAGCALSVPRPRGAERSLEWPLTRRRAVVLLSLSGASALCAWLICGEKLDEVLLAICVLVGVAAVAAWAPRLPSLRDRAAALLLLLAPWILLWGMVASWRAYTDWTWRRAEPPPPKNWVDRLHEECAMPCDEFNFDCWGPMGAACLRLGDHYAPVDWEYAQSFYLRACYLGRRGEGCTRARGQDAGAP